VTAGPSQARRGKAQGEWV